MAITQGQYFQLVMADMLQDYIVDKDTGAPLAGGWVSMFVDTSRTTFKNWYYQTGTPGNYTFIPLDNPLQLSAVGTIQDPNGNDVIPFYYPFDESVPNQSIPQAYFVQVNTGNSDGSMGAVQFTRENFPFMPTGTPIIDEIATNENYIINNEFWRNIGGPVTYSSASSNVIAPSQHDGFEAPDIRYIKTGTSTDILTFDQFSTDNALTGDITPEFYLNVNCTAGASDGALPTKYLQFPISLHLATLSGATVSISFQAQNVSNAPNNTITVGALAVAGTGAATNVLKNYQTFTIGPNWQKYTIPDVTLPSKNNPPIALSTAGDDSFYLLLQFPSGVGVTFNMNIAKPQIYVGATTFPTNQFDTYDQIDSIINSPRTGDIRISMNTFAPYGWVPMDDGTIGNASSTATTRANIDTWPLFNLLWTTFNPGLGNTSPYVPIYTNAVTIPKTLSTFGATAYSDWLASKQLQLTSTLGRVIAGTASDMPINITFTTAGSTTYTVTSGSLANVNTGMPINVTLNNGAGQPYVGVTYYIKVLSASTFTLYSHFDSATGLATQITAGDSQTGNTLIIPDQLLGSFEGQNYGSTTSVSTGYPGAVTTGTTAIFTRPPVTYANIFMKL